MDTNTLFITVMGVITGVCAVGFLRAQLELRKVNRDHQISSIQDEMWRMEERIGSRLHSLERSCCKQEKCEKSYYNTGA